MPQSYGPRAGADPKIRATFSHVFEQFIEAHVVLASPILREHATHGFPHQVLRDRDTLVLHFDPVFYDRMRIEVKEDRLCCILSFDRLYNVEIPFASVMQVTSVFPLFETTGVVDEETPNPPQGFKPRLVTEEDES